MKWNLVLLVWLTHTHGLVTLTEWPTTSYVLLVCSKSQMSGSKSGQALGTRVCCNMKNFIFGYIPHTLNVLHQYFIYTFDDHLIKFKLLAK